MNHLQKNEEVSDFFSSDYLLLASSPTRLLKFWEQACFFLSRGNFDNHNSPVLYSTDTELDTEFHFPSCQIACYLYRSLTHVS